MNLDQVLKDLGLSERTPLLRSKQVTLNTFRDMDGSAKQIKMFSQKLGLPADEIVDIKAHIEENTPRLEANASNEPFRQNQFLRSQGPSKHYQTQLTSRQGLNSKSIEFRNARANGQMVFGQKGSLMKQDKVVLDYGRKNRLQKIVQGSQALAQSSQNLARKGTQQLSMNMDQYLASKGAASNGKHAYNQFSNSNPKQSSCEPHQQKFDTSFLPKPVNGITSKYFANYSKSPELLDLKETRNASFDKMKTQNGNHSGLSSSMIGLASRNQANQNRQSSANSDKKYPNSNMQSSQEPSQKVSATFGPSNGIQSSNGPPSSSIDNNQANRLNPDQIQQRNRQVAEQNSKLIANELVSSEQNEQKKYREEFKIPFSQSEQNLPKVKIDSLLLQANKSNGFNDSQAVNQTNLKEANLKDMTSKMLPSQAHVNTAKPDLTNERLQHLGNKQSQEYLSEKLGKLCNQQANYPKEQSQENEQIDPKNNDKPAVFRDVEKSNVPDNVNPNHYLEQQNSQKVSQTVSQIEQYDGKEDNQGQLQASESDLDDPDMRYDDEVDDHNQDMQIDNDQDNQMQQYSDEEEQVDDQSDQHDQHVDDDSNSQLSDHQALHPPDQLADNQNIVNSQQVQTQHHSRPTIGMKQPAQHYLNKYDQPMDKQDVRSLASESSSMQNLNGQNPLQQPSQNQNYYGANHDHDRYNTNSDRSDEALDEEQSEFFQDKEAAPVPNQAEEVDKNQYEAGGGSKQHEDDGDQIPEDEESYDKDSSEEKSGDDNYDDEEMPEDTEYQKKVQELHENRQRSAQHLWGAPRLSQNNGNQGSQPLSQTKVNESNNTQNEAAPRESHAGDNEDESSEVSDDDENSEQIDVNDANGSQYQKNTQNESDKMMHVEQKVQHEQTRSVVNGQLSQASQPRHDAMQSQKEQSLLQKSQYLSNHQQSQQMLNASQNANIAVYNNDPQKQNYGRQFSQDQQKNSAMLNNQGCLSSQNTFLEMAAAVETVQQSKHSSIAHSFHRQQLQSSQQQFLAKKASPVQHLPAQVNQNPNLTKDHKPRPMQHQANGLNGMNISQQSSFNSNLREPHHLLIENDEKSNGLNNSTKQYQSNNCQGYNQTPTNQAGQTSQTIAQAQPNNQEMFEQLHNQMKVQSQGSNFNLSLKQMNANNNMNSNSQNEVYSRRQQTQTAQIPLHSLMKDRQSNDVSPQSRYSQMQEQNPAQANQQTGLKQHGNANVVSQTSQAYSPLTANKMVAQSIKSASGLDPQMNCQKTKSQNLLPLQVQNQVVQYITHSTHHNQRILSCNKEIGAQDDLKQILIGEAIERTKASTTKEVTERVTEFVTKQVTQEVRQRTAEEVSVRVRMQVESELNGAHVKQIQALKDQYEQSAQQSNRQEEKLHHQIGQLESAVSDANKHLDEKQLELKRLTDQRNELLSQIQQLEQAVLKKNSELENNQHESQVQQEKDQATIQQLVMESQVDRSNIVILNQKIQNQSEKVETTQKHVEKVTDQLQKINAELSDERQKYEQLESKFLIVQANISNKESQIANLNSQIQQLKEKQSHMEEQKQIYTIKLKEQAEITNLQLKKTIEEMQKERNRDQNEKADLIKQLDEAKKQTQRALDREQNLLKQQRARSVLPNQQHVNSPKHQQIYVSDRRSLTPQAQTALKQSPQASKNIQSAKTDLMSRNSTANAQSPQNLKPKNEQSSPSFVQSQKDLQLKQERLQQLLQLQMKQDELIKLEMQLKTSKQKVSQSYLQQSSNEHASQNQQTKSVQSPNCTDFEIKKNICDTKYIQAMSQQNESVGGFGDRNKYGSNQNGLNNLIELMDDGEDEQEEQEQDDDHLICNSGSKNKMQHMKEESSYLPDCVETEKNEKKKIIKKVRFHDDEQQIEHPFKNDRPSDSNQDMSLEQANIWSNERPNQLHAPAHSLGKKRPRPDADHQPKDALLQSQDPQVGQYPHDSYLQKIQTIQLEQSNQNKSPQQKNHQVETNQFVGRQNISCQGKFNSKIESDDEEKGGYKRQKNFEQQAANGGVFNGPQVNSRRTNVAALDSADSDMPVKPTSNRLRKKIFQEDQASSSISEDNLSVADNSNNKQIRKKKKMQSGKNGHDSNVSSKLIASNANGLHCKSPSGTVPANQFQKQASKSANAKANSSTANSTSASLQQKMKQIVGSNDQYLKKNPNLLSMIMAMSKNS